MAIQFTQLAHLNSELTKLNGDVKRHRDIQLARESRLDVAEEFVMNLTIDGNAVNSGYREVTLDGLSKPGVAYLQLTPTPSGNSMQAP
jgi:hypothetical protein